MIFPSSHGSHPPPLVTICSKLASEDVLHLQPKICDQIPARRLAAKKTTAPHSQNASKFSLYFQLSFQPRTPERPSNWGRSRPEMGSTPSTEGTSQPTLPAPGTHLYHIDPEGSMRVTREARGCALTRSAFGPWSKSLQPPKPSNLPEEEKPSKNGTSGLPHTGDPHQDWH